MKRLISEFQTIFRNEIILKIKVIYANSNAQILKNETMHTKTQCGHISRDLLSNVN